KKISPPPNHYTSPTRRSSDLYHTPPRMASGLPSSETGRVIQRESHVRAYPRDERILVDVEKRRMVGSRFARRHAFLVDAEHEIQPGNVPLVVGVILRARDQRVLLDVAFARRPLERRHHAPEQLGVVARDGRVRVDGHGDARAGSFRDVIDGAPEPRVQLLANAGIERADRALEAYVVRNDVAAKAAADAADGDHRGSVGDVELPRGNALQGGDDLPGHVDRVDAAPGRRAVGLPPADVDR